jgi:hypothetical protein
MRSRPLALTLALSSLVAASVASAQTPSPMTDGMVAGGYLRLSGGIATPVNPGGSLKEWNAGPTFNVMWENWENTDRGTLSLFGFGLYANLALLPFDESQFIQDFANGPNGTVLSARAGRSRAIQFGVNTRFRIPAPYFTPSIGLGFGFLDWHPASIEYVAVGGSGTAKQENRQGVVLALTGAIDKHIFDRVSIFGEASYAYGYTSFGQGLGASGSACIAVSCDLLRNMPFGTIRAGLKTRLGPSR